MYNVTSKNVDAGINPQFRDFLVNNFEKYLDRHNLTKRTVRSYKSDINQFLKWITDNRPYLPITSIDKIIVNKYLRHIKMTKGVAAAQRKLSALRRFSTFLSINEFIENSFTTDVSANPSDLDKYKKYINNKHYYSDAKAFSDWLYQNGLKVEDVNKGTINVYLSNLNNLFKASTVRRKASSLKTFIEWYYDSSGSITKPAPQKSNKKYSKYALYAASAMTLGFIVTAQQPSSNINWDTNTPKTISIKNYPSSYQNNTKYIETAPIRIILDNDQPTDNSVSDPFILELCNSHV